MITSSTIHYPIIRFFIYLENNLRCLIRAKPDELAAWLVDDLAKLKLCLLILCVGGSLYGMSLGLLRAPLQGFYVAIKLPLLLILTALGNTLINGMLVQLFGVSINFRKSLLIVFMNFTLLAAILGSFAPLNLFLLWNLQNHESANIDFSHTLYLLVNIFFIAFAGGIANRQLFLFLEHICNTPKQAWKILSAWLGINLFLGAQIAWNLRPFFGTPSLEVQFLRPKPFEGNFYESVFRMLLHLSEHL